MPENEYRSGPVHVGYSPKKEPGLLRKAWDWANTPLTDKFSRTADKIADYIDDPQGEGGYLKGFLAGAVQGVGNLATESTSPIGLLSTDLGIRGIKQLKDLYKLKRAGELAAEESKALRAAFSIPERKLIPHPLPDEAYTHGNRLRDKYAKSAGHNLVESLEEGPVKDAARVANRMNPKAMGHVTEIQTGKIKPSFGTDRPAGVNKAIHPHPDDMQFWTPEDYQSTIRIDPWSWQNKTPRELLDTVAHELEHASQRKSLGSPEMIHRYEDWIDEAGYWENPFEVQARYRGALAKRRAFGDKDVYY